MRPSKFQPEVGRVEPIRIAEMQLLVRQSRDPDLCKALLKVMESLPI